MMNPSEQEKLRIWDQHAATWQGLIDGNRIESRKLVTNTAILSEIGRMRWGKAWDIGCGEGWLSREMAKQGIQVLGTDGSNKLIQTATQYQTAHTTFRCLSYGDLIGRPPIPEAPFEGMVINYALFDQEITAQLLTVLPQYLKTDGHLLIQTVHPLLSFSPDDVQGRWESNIWEGLPGSFQEGYPWYNRTMKEWEELFATTGWRQTGKAESQHPVSGNWLSIVFKVSPM